MSEAKDITQFERVSAAELVDSGLLFLINWAILHPLGLGLGADLDESNGDAFVGAVVDGRDEETPVAFDQETMVACVQKLSAYAKVRGLKDLKDRIAKKGSVEQSAALHIDNPELSEFLLLLLGK